MRKRRWPAMLLILIAIALIACAIGLRIHKRNERKAALAKLEEYWTVEYESSCPKWLIGIIGPDWGQRLFPMVPRSLSYVTRFSGNELDRDAITSLEAFPSIRGLFLVLMNERKAGAAFAEISVLQNLPELTIILLMGPACNDPILKNVGKCKALTRLTLVDVGVTDSGLKHLHGLTNLKEVFLEGGLVTEEGLDELRKALPNCEVNGQAWSGDN